MNRRYIITIIISTFLFVFISTSIVIGYVKNSINRELKQSSLYENKSEWETVKTANNEEKKVSPNATIHLRQQYKQCGHITEEKIAVPKELVNKNESDIKKYYYGWTLEQFSEKEIRLYRENHGVCQEHYTVRDVDGVITVYNKNDQNEESVFLVTEILTKYLPKEDAEKLEKGIEIVGKKNLYMLLQDYE